MVSKTYDKIEKIKEALRNKNLKEDIYGNFKYDTANGPCRYKFGKTAIRAEIKLTNTWYRRWSAYYKDVNITDDGKISPVKRIK